MAYLLYGCSLLALVVGTILYLTRSHWLAAFSASTATLRDRLDDVRFRGQDYLYARLPSTFAGDIEAGLSSTNFDLRANVDDSDGRAGLDDTAKREILQIMKRRRLRFDEARRVYMEQRFQANGIGADGRPKDPKFVSFS